MSTIEERTAYKDNPYFTGHIYGNFSPFYVTITICTVIGVFIILLNIICACCSKYKNYWQDRHTGNRWLVSIWSATPHKQPPLDFTELKDVSEFQQTAHVFQQEEDVEAAQASLHQQLQQQLHYHQQQQHQQQQRAHRSEPRAYHSRQREEYVELQKRESDI